MWRVLKVFFVLCAVLIPLELLLWVSEFQFPWVEHTHPPHYGWEHWKGFYAVFGFVGCSVLVLISRFVLRPLVMRREDYYGDE